MFKYLYNIIVMNKLIFLLLLLNTTNCFAIKSNIVIKYSVTESEKGNITKEMIKKSDVNSIFFRLSNNYFPFSKKLTLQYGGFEEPSYDPESNMINIPYSFVQKSMSYFIDNKSKELLNISPKKGALDTLLHTLLHEAGHAFIFEKHIPILGKEEDAVDDFATILLLNYVENGDYIAINAAKMFSFESENKPKYYDFGEFIGEHSFDLQRYFSILCLVYGNQSLKHESLLNEIEDDYIADRKDYCKFKYSTSNSNWEQYLKTNNY